MLHICQQLASLLQQYNTSSVVFFISYFDFKFISTYNSILFCCLRRNVELCCHTHDSRTTVIVYSARPRLVGLALYTVTDNPDCVQRVAFGRPIHAVNRKPVAKCKNTNQGAAVIDRKARYSFRIEILAYPICIRGGPRQGGSRRNIAMPFCTEKNYTVVQKKRANFGGL